MSDETLRALAAEAHEVAVSKGWWEGDRNVGEIIANIHSEVTEAWKEWVSGREPDETHFAVLNTNPDVIPEDAAEAWQRFKDTLDLRTVVPDQVPQWDQQDLQTLVRNGMLEPHGVPTELADILIRVLDLFAAWGLDPDTSVRDKMEFNKHRQYKHGGKRA